MELATPVAMHPAPELAIPFESGVPKPEYMYFTLPEPECPGVAKLVQPSPEPKSPVPDPVELEKGLLEPSCRSPLPRPKPQ